MSPYPPCLIGRDARFQHKDPPTLQMHGGNGVAHPLHKTTRTILSICGQINIRVYNRFILCFPFPPSLTAEVNGSRRGADTRPRIDSHLCAVLDTLAAGRPEFAGRLELVPILEDGERTSKSGYVCIKQSPSYAIPYESHGMSSSFGWTYSELKAQGFPAKAFVHPRFDIPCDIAENSHLPATTVKTLYLDGGMLLCVWVHHTLADGDGVGAFLHSFAAATRGDDVGTPECLDLDLIAYHERIQHISRNKSFQDLIDQCPEYGIHDKPSCPTSAIELPGGTPIPDIEKMGRIFVFRKSAIDRLKTKINKCLPPGEPLGRHGPYASCYNALAALTWAHVAKARLQAEEFAPVMSDPKRAVSGRLMNPVNWKDRALSNATRDYYGNATALAITQIPLHLLASACEDESLGHLATIAYSIKRAINSIDDEFVCRRLATYYAAPDPRYIGLDIDPRTPQDLGFNTWESIGADTEWCLSGISTSTTAPLKPDSIRRAQGAWNMGGCVILPSKKDSPVWELVVTLPEVSMELLCKDEGYLRWVDRVLD